MDDVETSPLEDSELLLEIVRALVDKPESVRVYEREYSTGNGVTLHIECDPSDRGKVIGRKGKTIDCLKHLLSSIGAIDGRRIMVRVIDR